MECADIIGHILSFNILPRHKRVSQLWNSISMSIMEKNMKDITDRYPEWQTNDGIVALNRAALNKDWDIFRVIMQYNTIILCDDAMEIAYIFHKDNLVHIMYNLYKDRNGYSPIRAYYMWQHNILGKEEALDNMMGIIKYYNDVGCLYNRITPSMKAYIEHKYGNATFLSGKMSILVYKDVYYYLSTPIERYNNRVVTQNQIETYTNAIVHKNFHPHGYINSIIYDIYMQYNSDSCHPLFKIKPYTTETIPTPSKRIVYTLDSNIRTNCEAIVKKTGVRCKNRAKYCINEVYCCGTHGKFDG